MYFKMHKRSKIVEKLEELNKITRVNQRVITGITTTQSDSEAVFVKSEVRRYCISNGMMQVGLPPFVHEMNGLIESAIKTDFITARACLIASGLCEGLWWWALQHTAHTRFVTLASEGYGRDQTLFETWFGYRQMSAIYDLLEPQCTTWSGSRARVNMSSTPYQRMVYFFDTHQVHEDHTKCVATFSLGQ